MSFDKPTRNQLSRLVSTARDTLRIDITAQLQTNFRLQPDGTALSLDGLTDDQRTAAEELRQLLDHFAALIPASSDKKINVRAQAHDRLVREIGFTILNRLAALRLCEERGLVIECVRAGMASAGFQMFDRLANGALGPRYETYRAFLENLFDELAIDLGVLFDRHSPLSHVFPGERALEDVLGLLNDPALTPLWIEDETIGWIYQYYNDDAERKQMRDESQAPRNSRELAVRNQFFTPRYVVEFLTDNTLGRIWYEMRGGDTALREKCRYMVIRPDSDTVTRWQDDTLRATIDNSGDNPPDHPVIVSPGHLVNSTFLRPKKDPRDIKMLDPAGGSGHFGLYCFDLFETIYTEAYDDPDLGPKLQADYPERAAFLRDVPRLILEHNIHIIDIDPRACQIAALALWLRAQRSWKEMGLKAHERPRVTKTNVVCAEPMPGERDLLDEFAVDLQPPELADLVRFVFDRMQLAGEAGSLLKIEEDLRTKIEELRAKTGPLFAQGDFWDNAEARVLSALKDYTEQASNGGTARRLLFADDAAQGFAFIDLCLKKYDAVLMNPPFGWAASSTKTYLDGVYPNSKNDLYCAFVDRSLRIIVEGGRLGSITSRTAFFLPAMRLWRQNVLLGDDVDFQLMADLGFGVLDSAFVETAAFVVESRNQENGPIAFYRLNESTDKASDLRQDIARGSAYLIRKSELKQLPGYPFSYWVPSKVRQLFTKLRSLDESGVTIAVGLVSGENERFLRTRWEIPPGSSRWILYPKGGDYSKFHQDIYLMVDWDREGAAIKAQTASKHGSASRFVQNTALYGKAGLTYPNISVKGFNVRVLPSGCIFSHVGQGIFTNSTDKWYLLGILNTGVIEYLLRSLTPSRKWDTGFIKAIPLPKSNASTEKNVREAARKLYNLVLKHDLVDETTAKFLVPNSIVVGGTLGSAFASYRQIRVDIEGRISQLAQELEEQTLSAYGLLANDIKATASSESMSEAADSQIEDVADNGVVTETDADLSMDLVSYLTGVAFSRWDIRFALDPSLAPKLQDPFDPLPVCPPGMLVGPDGLPATPGHIVSEGWLRARPNAITLPPSPLRPSPCQGKGPEDRVDTIPDSAYPIRIAWDGILVDDLGLDETVEHSHPEDIVRRVRDVLGVLWGDRADAIEQEACEILGVKSLRDYFRAPSGFFADHLKRYSKSRRQAPIYWPLSTASGRYTVWVYYHRLTSDTLFTIVNHYVTPKIDDVQTQVDRLSDKAKAASGKAAVDLRAQLDDLKGFLSELNDFKAELLRIAALPYKPDLNDGVIINAAPLHSLFRLRKWATDTAAVWKKLEAGEYEWAHLAYTVWPKRVEKVCETDRSIAIAHGLESLCKVEVKKSKGKRKKKTEEEEDLE